MKDQLRAFGFSEKEIAVYLALLEIGSSVVSSIAKRARINRSTAYVILGTLSDRGLITVVERRGVKLYNSTPPEKLVQHLESLSKQYAQFATTAKKLVPELKSLDRSKNNEGVPQPKVQFFEGEEGVKTVYEDTLSSLEAIRAYASVGEVTSKTKKGAKVQVIFPNSAEEKRQMIHTKEEAGEAFRIPSGNYGFASEINIYDTKVIFIAPAEKFGLIIENREFADTLKKAFISARKEVTKLGKKSFFSAKGSLESAG